MLKEKERFVADENARLITPVDILLRDKVSSDKHDVPIVSALASIKKKKKLKRADAKPVSSASTVRFPAKAPMKQKRKKAQLKWSYEFAIPDKEIAS